MVTSSDTNYSFAETHLEEFDFPKVELHLHLGGTVRPKTAFYFAKKRNVDIKFNTPEELDAFITCDKPFHLPDFIVMYDMIIKSVVGNAEALRQIAYELVESKAKEGVKYVEVRYSPHLYATHVPERRIWKDALGDMPYEPPVDTEPLQHQCIDVEENGTFTPDDVILNVTEGLAQGEKEFNVIARSILCCIRPHPAWSYEVVELAKKYKHLGVVGIDLAADETIPDSTVFWGHVKAFQEAERHGIYRTVHAGESCSSESVRQALNVLKANRIGHGYLVSNDEELYKRCIEERVHFEVCPSVFRMSPARNRVNHKCHALQKFNEDGLEWSINTDDPAYFKKTLGTEYKYAQSLGITIDDLKLSNLNAARASFLPDDEKQELIEFLEDAYGMKE